jgi:hypothetical protein
MIIIGAGINHWYHANLMYRAGAMALMLALRWPQWWWTESLCRSRKISTPWILGVALPLPKIGRRLPTQQAPLWH